MTSMSGEGNASVLCLCSVCVEEVEVLWWHSRTGVQSAGLVITWCFMSLCPISKVFPVFPRCIWDDVINVVCICVVL